MLMIPASTQEYVYVPLTAWSGDVEDPTALPVAVAIVPAGAEPAAGDYTAGTWVTDTSGHRARVLWQTAVPSPQPHTTYEVWLRITSNPETPVLRAGKLRTY